MNNRHRVIDTFKRLKWFADVSSGQQRVDEAIAQAEREMLILVGELPKESEPLLLAETERWG